MAIISNIRNVAFVGLNRGGKTSLIEAILHLTGSIPRRGKIQDGTMTMDYEPEAVSRQISTQVSFARATYNNVIFNILDCPGFVDFLEEVKLALCGADAAIFVIEPDPSKIIQIDALLHYTEEIGISRLVFINKLDKPDIDFSQTFNVLKNLTGSKAPHPLVCVQYPIFSSHGITGYLDILKKESFSYETQGNLEPTNITPTNIPKELQSEFDREHEKLIESLADTDDSLLEMVLEEKEPPIELLEQDLKRALKAGTIVPILVGSANVDSSVHALLNSIISLCPSPSDCLYKDKNDKSVTVSENGPIVAQVIKTYINPQSGKLSLTRVFSGTISGDSQLADSTTDGTKERIGGLYNLIGKKQETVASMGLAQ